MHHLENTRRAPTVHPAVLWWLGVGSTRDYSEFMAKQNTWALQHRPETQRPALPVLQGPQQPRPRALHLHGSPGG